MNLGLQSSMRMDVIPFQRLLHHEELELIELSQMIGVFQSIGRVGVNRKQDPGELISNGIDIFQILAGFDF
jgi:hypothetical protein